MQTFTQQPILEKLLPEEYKKNDKEQFYDDAEREAYERPTKIGLGKISVD